MGEVQTGKGQEDERRGSTKSKYENAIGKSDCLYPDRKQIKKFLVS